MESEQNEVVYEGLGNLSRTELEQIFRKGCLSGEEEEEELSERERKEVRVHTWCNELDDALGGGLRMCELTELCSFAGCGKTTLCMQLCLSAQLPTQVGGCGFDSHCLFIDTQRRFSAKRLREMAEYCQTHVSLVKTARQIVIEDMLKQTHVVL